MRSRNRPSGRYGRTPIARGIALEGDWLWTSRPGAENDVVDEIAIALGPARARVIGPSLVRSRGAPTFADGGIDLTFARQGFRIAAELAPERCAEAIAPLVRGQTWALSVWTPDADATNSLQTAVAALEERTLAELPLDGRVSVDRLPKSGAIYAQIALVARDRAIVGAVRTEHAISLFPGGRARMRVAADRPSRAARKVEEALAWLGLAPGPGETCVDLGAAPGGWSWALLRRRARVIAVDPAELRADVAHHRALVHRKQSAFEFTPDEPVDWLFCDMAWRPLEVAQLLAKWGRRRWARLLVANLKLPMKKKAAMVAELRSVIAGGGWQSIRTRQLYHDRDEITLTAHL